MNYRQKRKAACQKLFDGFLIDLGGCRKKETVLKILALAKEGYFSREIAEMIGITPKAVQKTYRRYNFPVLQNFAPPRREERLGWKGGVKESGEHLYSRTPNHPMGSKHGSYVAVHRLVYEEYLGRYLTREEVIHHKDDNPHNNDISNLMLYKNNAEHLKETLKGKCPNWSDEGKKKLRESALRRRIHAPSTTHYKTKPYA